MSEAATYSQPETISDTEVLKIVFAVVDGLGPVTEEAAAPVIQCAIDMLHEARTDEALIRLVMDGQLAIVGMDDHGDLVFQKQEAHMEAKRRREQG